MKANTRTLILRIGATLIVALLAVICVFPFIWMVSASFKNEIDVMEFPIRIIPKVVNWTNYSTVWLKSDFPNYYRNSLIVTGITLVGTICLSTTAAWVCEAEIPRQGADLWDLSGNTYGTCAGYTAS